MRGSKPQLFRNLVDPSKQRLIARQAGMTPDKRPPIVLSMGDPAGCGPQITALAWKALHKSEEHRFFVVGNRAIYERYCPVETVANIVDTDAHFSRALPVLELDTDAPMPEPGEPSEASAPAIIASIEKATALAFSRHASAIVTNPINKALLYGTGFDHPGHTEFLSHLCKEKNKPAARPVMMLVGGGLRVALTTIHMPLIDVAGALNQNLLLEIAEITHKALQTDFGLKAPRLAFTGLNPHAGENGTIGREEIETINPAAAMLRVQGINISDARPADTVFAESLSGAYDAVIAMTHDQGLIPVKTLDFWGGVNVTLGLPIIRTSPDHGTAYDAAAKGKCRADSLIAAIKLAAENAGRRYHAPA